MTGWARRRLCRQRSRICARARREVSLVTRVGTADMNEIDELRLLVSSQRQVKLSFEMRINDTSVQYTEIKAKPE
jgi:hypothetical protein